MLSLMAVGLGLSLSLLWIGFYFLIRRLKLVHSTAIGVIHSLLSGLFWGLFFIFTILMISFAMHYFGITQIDQRRTFGMTAMVLWLLTVSVSALVLGPW
jgi:hypothetical protein